MKQADWRVVALAGVLAVLAACSNGDDPSNGGATVPTVAPTTIATDPYAIPAAIDVTYVNRVLVALDAVSDEAFKLVMRTNTIPPDAVDRVKAIYASGKEQLPLDALQFDLRNGFRDYRPNPGSVVTAVQRLIKASPACIFAEVSRDYSAVGINPQAPSQQWVGLRPLDPARDPAGYNPTRWAFVYDGFPRDRSQPDDPCAAP